MIGETDAIVRARRALGFGDTIQSRGWLVHRLDRPNQSYFLVELGGENTPDAVATVDSISGEVTHSARLPHPSRLKTPQELLGENLGAPDVTLVWQPCDASRSPLYPLWQIRTKDDLFYLDQSGQRWYQLQISGRGG
jgi:hypothetical protein